MNQTERTLLEQMRITDFEIEGRKVLLMIDEEDIARLRNFRPVIEASVDALVNQFYKQQTSVPEIALLIGDADTLGRLSNAQRKYVLDLFSGLYDLEYVNNRLRIGLVHKRIGVEPKLYLAAINTLKGLLVEKIFESVEDEIERQLMIASLDKLLLFDITLVFETYIRSLVSEIEISKEKSERYASVLEEKVRERTRQLEEKTRIDPLTGLLSVRYLNEALTRTLRAAQRRSEYVSVVYLDIDGFKDFNDTLGHQHGDEVLHIVGDAIKSVSRTEDSCFRYGGDEFCLILPNCKEDMAREIYINRLSAEITQRIENVTLSVGIVEASPYDFVEPEKLIQIADERMYVAKRVAKQNGKTQ